MNNAVMRLTKCQWLSLDLPRSHLNGEICLSKYYFLNCFLGTKGRPTDNICQREQKHEQIRSSHKQNVSAFINEALTTAAAGAHQ